MANIFEHALRACMHYGYCVINNYKLLTTFQSVMLNSNEPIKVVDTQKLVNQSLCN